MRRIVIVSPQPVSAEAYAATLAALPDTTVETIAPERCTEDAEPAALWLIDLGEGGAVPPVRGPRLVIAPAELSAWLDLLTASDGLVGVMTADAARAGDLGALVERLSDGVALGFESFVAAEAEVHERTVGDYAGKQRCVAEVVAIAERLQLSRPVQHAIEQSLDELVMNALFDAPIDRVGKRVFAGVPSATRVTLRTDATVLVRFGWDSRRFVVGVRDEFGSLARSTVLGHVAKGLRSSEPVDRRVGGAGLGLFLTVTSASGVWFDVVPGRGTEVVCLFDREASHGSLAQLGIRMRADPVGSSPRTTRSRSALSLRARSRRWLAANPRIAIGIVAAVAVAAVAPRIVDLISAPQLAITTSPDGATVELEGHRIATTDHGPAVFRDIERGRTYTVRAHRDGYQSVDVALQVHAGENSLQLTLPEAATVELASTPPGAAVQLDGRPAGWTPLELELPPQRSTMNAVFTREGYRPATARVEVPAAGQRTRFEQALVLADGEILVHFESDPPGAAIVRTGQPLSSDRTYTPADVLVEENVVQSFSFEMPGHATVVLPPFTIPHGGSASTERATLAVTR